MCMKSNMKLKGMGKNKNIKILQQQDQERWVNKKDEITRKAGLS